MSFLKKCSYLMAVCIFAAMGMTVSAQAKGVSLPKVQGPIPVTENSIPFNAASMQTTPIDLKALGYTEEEYFLTGKANVYEWNQDGKLAVRTPDASYTNRIIVRKPADPKKFSGNVFVEIVNSTSSYDIQVLWGSCHDKFLQDGDIYVGITSKPVSIKALQKYNPQRYAALSWANPLPEEKRGKKPGDYMPPGVTGSFVDSEDGLVWDIISQTSALLRSKGKDNPLHGYNVEKVYGIGASQSAVVLTGYISTFHPITTLNYKKPLFDGYMLTVGAYPLQLNQDSTIILPKDDPRTKIDHCNVPVIRFMSESDFRSMGPWPFLDGRRADSDSPDDRFRLYEVPGSAHAVYYTIAYRAGKEQLTAIGQNVPGIPQYIPNEFPFQYLFKAGLKNLDHWVREGIAPPKAPRIELEDKTEKDMFGNIVPIIKRDEFGNALGGLRTPYLDVPLGKYTGSVSVRNPLNGQFFPMNEKQLKALYSSNAVYAQKFSEKVDELVKNHWVTPEDGEQMKKEMKLPFAE